MNSLLKKPVGDIVAEDYRTAQVLRSYGLDFCCGGGKTLERACSAKKIEIDEVISELEALKNEAGSEHNYNEWSLDFLADYIVNNHHAFVRKMLPELAFYAEKVSRVHGDRDPELNEIRDLVYILQKEMMAHLQKEEDDLFPQIKELVRDSKTGGVKGAIVEALEDEHDNAGEIMAKIEALTNGFTPPSSACSSYRVLFQNLEGFQKDLHKHVHLENNILFPKALRMEQLLN